MNNGFISPVDNLVHANDPTLTNNRNPILKVRYIQYSSSFIFSNDDLLGDAQHLVANGTNGAPSIRGMPGGTDGRIMVITNLSNTSMNIANESSGALAPNRFTLLGGNPIGLDIGVSLIFVYSSFKQRWIQILPTYIYENFLLLSDVTTNNATITAHGLLKKLSGSMTDFMRGDGNWAQPVGCSLYAYYNLR